MKSITLEAIHTKLGAKMGEFAGYRMPIVYTNIKEEHLRVRESVGVFDVSHMGEFWIEGPQALELIQKVSSNDASKLIDGQAQYACMPNDTGGIVDDLIIYRINPERFMLVVNASNIDKDWQWISSHNSMNAQMSNHSEKMSLLAVQGPKATQVLQKLTQHDLSSIKYYHFTIGTLADIPDVIISATGYTGSGGFELYVSNEAVEHLWNAVFEAGAEFGILPIGLAARDTLRLEMGYCLYGNDIDDTTNPIEAGLGWITKLDKDFIGRQFAQKIKDNGVSRKLVGIKLLERGVARKGYEILDHDGHTIGIVTSGSLTPSLDYPIALGYVQTPWYKIGSQINIKIREQTIKAEVVKLPFFNN